MITAPLIHYSWRVAPAGFSLFANYNDDRLFGTQYFIKSWRSKGYLISYTHFGDHNIITSGTFTSNNRSYFQRMESIIKS